MSQLVPKDQKEDTTSIIAFLRRSPRTRAVLYLGSAATLLEVLVRLQDMDQPYAFERLHLKLVPFVTALTYSFVRMRSEDRTQWTKQSIQHHIRHVGMGVGLGTGAILSFFAIAAANGWVSAPTWGWKDTAPSVVGRSMAIIALGNLAVAWNEEVIFRGYGYDTLRLGMPQAVATAITTALFAYSHAPGLGVKVGEAALGLTLLFLREASDGIAAPIGYHWAWNFVQTGIFGPAESTPSLRPLQVHGPSRWIGRPGYSDDPGILVIAFLIATALSMWVYLQRQKTEQRIRTRLNKRVR